MLAGMGGVSYHRLVAAVSEAGGFGCLGAGTMRTDEMVDEIRQVKAATDKPFGVDLLTALPDRDARQRRSTSSTRARRCSSPPSACRARSSSCATTTTCIVVNMCGKVRHAIAAVEAGCDLVVAQGTEAGGHTGTVATMPLVPQVVDAVGDRVPVVAAGGIFDGRGLAAALALGADGVWIGTRFIATPEARAVPGYKDTLLATHEDGTVVSRAFSGKTMRVVRNDVTQYYEEHPDELKPFPEQMGVSFSGGFLHLPFGDAATGVDPKRECYPAGQGVGAVDELVPAAELVHALRRRSRTRARANERHDPPLNQFSYCRSWARIDAVHVWYPPSRLRARKPSSCISAVAVCPRWPTSQYTTTGPAPSASSRSRSESIGTLTDPGIAPLACSSAVRTSTTDHPSATRPSSSRASTMSQSPGEHVLRHVAEQVDGILGGRERRGVGELEVGEAVGGDAAGHRGRDHVDALVDAVAADDLRAEDRAVVGIEDQLRRHARRAGVVGGVVERVRVDRAERPARVAQASFAPPDGRGDDVEHLDDRGTERVDRVRRPSGDVVGHPPALPVGDVGQRDERGRVRDGVGLLDGVADGVDVGVARLVRVVDRDAAARAEVEAGHLGEADVGPDPDRADHEVGGEDAPVGEGHGALARPRRPSPRSRRGHRARRARRRRGSRAPDRAAAAPAASPRRR